MRRASFTRAPNTARLATAWQVFSSGAARGFGVRCPVALPAHAFVCEYTGEVFDTKADGGAREQRCCVRPKRILCRLRTFF
jgi:hypothetical protein